VAQIKDLPGCLTQGETLDETIANIKEARQLWIETAYEAGDSENGDRKTITISLG
jgi:predicted RNase H-like HicB family nuclease